MTSILWRLAILATVALAGFGVGVAVTRNHYRPIVSAMKEKAALERQAAAEAVAKAVQDNAKLVNQLEVNHEAANKALNILLDHPVGRVRLPSTPCAASNQIAATGGITVQTSSTERTSDTSQATFDGFVKGLESDAIEWRNAIEACRPVIEWAKAQSSP